MENWMLEVLAPKSLEEVLEAYVRAWKHPDENGALPTPDLRLHLRENHTLEGELVHVDFEKSQICLQGNPEGKKSVLYFVGLSEVLCFGLIAWEEYPEFFKISWRG